MEKTEVQKAPRIVNTERDMILGIRWDVEKALYRLDDLYTSLSNSEDAKRIRELRDKIWCHLENMVEASAEYDEEDDWDELDEMDDWGDGDEEDDWDDQWIRIRVDDDGWDDQWIRLPV